MLVSVSVSASRWCVALICRATNAVLACCLLASLPLAANAAIIVAAGGGPEGDIGDTSAWSYRLYSRLLANGDVNGDGEVRVVILSTGSATSFLPEYFVWLGATKAMNLRVSSRRDANDSAIVGPVADADAVFIRGGDQGEYYDRWNGTLLESHIRTVVQTRNGAIGGTSAGAMSLPAFAFAGGEDLISLDVLQDAQTKLLDDASDGGSGIHTDFLSFIANTVIDTHYTTRGRMGRLLGILGRAVSDSGLGSLLAIGISEETGIAINGSTAEVIGSGSVDFIQQTPETVLRRDARRPLYYTNLRLDRLTEGWKFDLAARLPNTSQRPAGTTAVSYAGDGSANSGSLNVRGSVRSDESRFAGSIDYDPNGYRLRTSSASPLIRNSLGLVDALNFDTRGAVQESLFRALYDQPGWTGFLLPAPAAISRSASTSDQLAFSRNSKQKAAEASTLVIDGKTMSYRGLSPYVSTLDSGDGSLQAAALINLRVHALAETMARGEGYDTRRHAIVGGP